ncbi:hypothetical protein V5799_031346 [Amblyomma americanum]|uniref:Uncharacterized protein n=1 Tax=Amblyomma americanum TaxID=6943 RepID=A0AAQ4EKP9_AMBAM
MAGCMFSSRRACCQRAPVKPLSHCSSLPRNNWVAPMSWSSSTKTATTGPALYARSCSWGSVSWPQDIPSCHSPLLKGSCTWLTPLSETWRTPTTHCASWLYCCTNSFFVLFLFLQLFRGGDPKCVTFRVHALEENKRGFKISWGNYDGLGEPIHYWDVVSGWAFSETARVISRA